MRIIGPASASRELVRDRIIARGAHNRFVVEMLPALWDAALEYGLDPVGVVVQSAKETGWGNFGGNVRPEFFNTAGIKIRNPNLFPGITDGDRPLAHQMFPNWEVGAEAHVQHLRAYTGWPVEGRRIVDPRYVWVRPDLRIETFAGLGGYWAPSQSYGVEIEALAKTLLTA